jgi:DNA-binding MurR/RpiR family transcriptional regulator
MPDVFRELPDLSDTELQVYNYVMSNPSKVVKMSIQKIAKETNTSTATLLRFCHELGYHGFSEFKFKLREELENKTFTSAPNSVNNLSDTVNFFAKTAVSRQFLDQIDRAAQILVTKKLILFVGLGSSNIMGEYGALYFSYLFDLAFRVEDIYNFPIDHFPCELAEQTCVVALSVSGETDDLLQYIRNPHTANCTTIAITSNANSRLAQISDACITYSLPVIIRNTSNLTTQSPCCYIIETLAGRVHELLQKRQKSGPEAGGQRNR